MAVGNVLMNIDCSTCPIACTPQVAIILGAFISLAVFSGGIASLVLFDKWEEFKQRRIYKLHRVTRGDHG